MDRKEAIEFLKEKIKEIPHLADLPSNNLEYHIWRNTIAGVLEEVFGRTSSEYENFSSKIKRGNLTTRSFYIRRLLKRYTDLESIIQKYEILENERESLERRLNRMEREFAAQLPLHLYDELHFHPKVVEASKSCFTAGNYREAILNAFIALIDYVKEKTKLRTDNKDLMAKTFYVDNPVIKLNSLKETYERDEQEGFRFLYMGAVVGIRNPKAHKLIPQSNSLHTLEYLAFASLLMRRVEEGELTS